MAYVESHTVLLRHRKLIELARSLRVRPVYAMGHLHALWHAALEQQEDGDLSSWSDDLIADAASFTGNAPQFVRLLQQHRWLDGKLIHDWLDYAGNYLRGKYARSNRERLVQIWLLHGRTYGQPANRDPIGCQLTSNGESVAPELNGTNHPPNPPVPGGRNGNGSLRRRRGMTKAQAAEDKRMEAKAAIDLYPPGALR